MPVEEIQNIHETDESSYSNHDDFVNFDFSYFEPKKSDTYAVIPKSISLLASSVETSVDENVFLAALDIKRAKELQYDERMEKDNDMYGKIKKNNDDRLSNQTGNDIGTSSTMPQKIASRNEFEEGRRFALENTNWEMFEKPVYLGSDREANDETRNFFEKTRERLESVEAEEKVALATQRGLRDSHLESKKKKNDVKTDKKTISSETFNFEIKPYYAGEKRTEASWINTEAYGDGRKKNKNNNEKNKNLSEKVVNSRKYYLRENQEENNGEIIFASRYGDVNLSKETERQKSQFVDYSDTGNYGDDHAAGDEEKEEEGTATELEYQSRVEGSPTPKGSRRRKSKKGGGSEDKRKIQRIRIDKAKQRGDGSRLGTREEERERRGVVSSVPFMHEEEVISGRVSAQTAVFHAERIPCYADSCEITGNNNAGEVKYGLEEGEEKDNYYAESEEAGEEEEVGFGEGRSASAFILRELGGDGGRGGGAMRGKSDKRERRTEGDGSSGNAKFLKGGDVFMGSTGLEGGVDWKDALRNREQRLVEDETKDSSDDEDTKWQEFLGLL